MRLLLGGEVPFGAGGAASRGVVEPTGGLARLDVFGSFLVVTPPAG